MKFLATIFLCALTSGLVAAQCDLATNVCEFTNQYLCKRAPSGIKYDNCGQTAKNNCKNGCPVTVSVELIESIYVRTYVYKPFITNGFVSSSSPSSVTLVFGMLRRIALVAVVIAIVDSRIDAYWGLGLARDGECFGWEDGAVLGRPSGEVMCVRLPVMDPKWRCAAENQRIQGVIFHACLQWRPRRGLADDNRSKASPFEIIVVCILMRPHSALSVRGVE